jgi:hypothetical protein
VTIGSSAAKVLVIVALPNTLPTVTADNAKAALFVSP